MTTPTTQASSRSCRPLLLTGLLLLSSLLAPAALAADLNNGKKLYMAHCAGCHGVDGNSVMPKAPNFSRGENLQQADFILANFIKSGSASHPPFFGIIVEREMFDVVSYLRNIR